MTWSSLCFIVFSTWLVPKAFLLVRSSEFPSPSFLHVLCGPRFLALKGKASVKIAKFPSCASSFDPVSQNQDPLLLCDEFAVAKTFFLLQQWLWRGVPGRSWAGCYREVAPVKSAFSPGPGPFTPNPNPPKPTSVCSHYLVNLILGIVDSTVGGQGRTQKQPEAGSDKGYLERPHSKQSALIFKKVAQAHKLAHTHALVHSQIQVTPARITHIGNFNERGSCTTLLAINLHHSLLVKIIMIIIAIITELIILVLLSQ